MVPASNQTPKIKFIASVASWGLIAASTGFGCVFAYNTMSHNHGKLMTACSILFVLGLEILKPLSISYSFSCFQRLQFVRGLLLALLGLVAVAYSLTAELALIYGARSDLAALRKGEALHAAGSQGEYERALAALQALPKARATAAEVQADITGLQARYRNVDWECEDIRDKQSKFACPLQAKLKAEIGVIERREKLQATIDNFLKAAPEKSAEKIADPGSAAITTYLGALGVQADQSTVAQWVVLIPIFALEIGSALGLLLVSAINEQPRIAVSHDEPPLIQPSQAARRALLRQLENNGEAKISQRRLAQNEGLDKSTIQRAAQQLREEGIIDLETHRKGTILKLKKT